MAKRHYTIYCDESAKKGRYFSNFYGGALVRSADREPIERILADKKEELNLYKELKWTRITTNYEQKYIEYIKTFFEFIRTGRVKVRIMFTHNYRKPKKLTELQQEDEYFILYYQMLKHAFGFQYSNPNLLDRIFITVLLDDIPHNKERLDKFKKFVIGIENTSAYRGKGVYFTSDQIADVDSSKHNILQGLDIILGAMQFRLNDMHKEKETGKKRRGKRTIAKERVYKEINRQIRTIYPNFNIGVTTGMTGGQTDRWEHPYRHWCLVPVEHEINQDAVKPR